MENVIRVVAAFIKKDGKILIAKRSTGDLNVLGKWEFPGGKVKENENELNAIEREMKEEFELEIKAVRLLTNNICEYPTKTVDLRLYECKYISGDFHMHDHSDFMFVSKNDLLKYELCPADIPLAVFVKENM